MSSGSLLYFEGRVSHGSQLITQSDIPATMLSRRKPTPVRIEAARRRRGEAGLGHATSVKAGRVQTRQRS